MPSLALDNAQHSGSSERKSDMEYPWEADGHSALRFTDGETWTQREAVTSWGSRKQLYKGMGKRRERKSSETQPYLAG